MEQVALQELRHSSSPEHWMGAKAFRLCKELKRSVPGFNDPLCWLAKCQNTFATMHQGSWNRDSMNLCEDSLLKAKPPMVAQRSITKSHWLKIWVPLYLPLANYINTSNTITVLMNYSTWFLKQTSSFHHIISQIVRCLLWCQTSNDFWPKISHQVPYLWLRDA